MADYIYEPYPYLDCPEIIEGVRCNALAEVTKLTWLTDSEGSGIKHTGTLCLNGHHLFFPEIMLKDRSHGERPL